jgi:cytochrome c peroxidase
VRDQQGNRNSPTAYNRLLSDKQFWDGRAGTLEEQAIGPIENPIEMAFSHEAAVNQLKTIEGYRLQFEAIFATKEASTPTNQDPITIENVGRVIASFELAIVTGPSPWDHYQRLADFEEANGDDLTGADPALAAEHQALQQAAKAAPLSDAARRGGELFYSDRSGCTLCHAGANFSDEMYHNLGVGMEEASNPDDQQIDWGRYAITNDDNDRGAFKTPTLRNVAQTAPYMHDGSQQTLAEVVEWYVAGGHDNAWLSPLIEPLDLTSEEQADLVAFLEALTGELPPVETARLP